MDSEKFLWLVDCGRLLMPSADRLGDPLEGTTPAGDLEWWRRAALNAESEEHRRIIDYNRRFQSRWAKKLRSNYYVSCWHMNQYENHAMWKCYTAKPSSVAVRTTYSALRDCLPNYVEMGLVRYIDYSTQRLPSMNMFEYVMHKEAYYEFEREVRAVVLQPVGEAEAAHFHQSRYRSESDPDLVVYAPAVDLSCLIKGVVLHPDAPAVFESQIVQLCLENGLPIPEPSRVNRRPVF
jgi:hypothetical protein